MSGDEASRNHPTSPRSTTHEQADEVWTSLRHGRDLTTSIGDDAPVRWLPQSGGQIDQRRDAVDLDHDDGV